MPMDYDDNDTSRHNLQLAGEGRTRSSSALRPYDFPKFDFDDSLQGHLRFDSLVETEVFLGIQSQEDNQWIEDFSRGSNGMEFNPTPADSCSISRRNNVWSEATSSESVEMLLKSVGQEEMMPGASIIPEPEVAANQGSPSRHVETSYKLNERNDAYVSNSETTLPLDEALNHYPDSRTHIEDRLKDALPTHAIVDSACGNSNDINQNALCGNGGASTNEGKHSDDDECAVKYTEESKASVEKTTDSGVDRDSSGFLGTADNDISNFVMPSSSKASEQVKSVVSHESCSSDEQEKNVSIKKALEDTEKLEGKAGVVNIQTCTASSSLGLDPESGRDSKEPSLDSIRESELKSSEGDDQYTKFTTSIQTLRHEDVLTTSNEVNEADGGFQGVSSVDGITQNTAELGSFNSDHCAGTQQKMDPTVQLPHKRDDDHMEDVSERPLTYEGMSEMPLLSMEDKEVPTERGDAIGNTEIGSSSDIAMVSSTADNKDAKNVDGCCNDSMVTTKDPGESLLAHEMNESIQGIQGNLVQRQDIRKTAKVDGEAFSDLRDIDSEDVGTLKADSVTQSPELGEGVKINDSICKLQPQISGELESANNLSSLATSDASAVPDDRPEIGQREPAAFGVTHSDNDREEAGTKKTHDALGTYDEDTSKDEVNVANDIVRTPPSEMAAKSQQLVEKVDDVYSTGTSSVDAVNSSYLDHQAHLGCKLKGSVDADLVSGDNLPKVLTKEEEKESAQSAEVDKATCGSPTIISSSEPLLLEKDNKDEEKGHQVNNENVEDKDIKSISEDPKRKDLLGDDSSFTFKVSALPDTSDVAPAKSWSPFPDVEKGKVVEEIAPSGKAKPGRTPSQKTPRQNAQGCDGESGPGTSKGTSERKGRRGPAKGMAKENVKKGNQSKGTIQENASKKVEKTSNNLSSTPSSSPLLQFGQMQPYGTIEAGNKKPSGAAAVPTSSLPDLNNSALNNSTCQSGPFRPPFTDLQQVQLRAQIFVYGSLLQGNAAPDEACMVSAFGASDGGRSTWEPIWRVAVERVRSQKSNSTSTAAETPRSQSGARTSDAAKQGSHSSKVLATPMSRASSKDTPAAVSNLMIPFSSPLWNIATPSRDNLTANTIHKGPVVDFQQAFTPVQSFQTPPIRNFVGHTSWPSQTCFSGPLLASPQNATFSSSSRFHPVTMTETVKLTSVKDSSAVLASSVKHMASIPAVHTVNPIPAMGGLSPLQDPKAIASQEQHSVDTKPRKRKKVPASDLSQVSLVSESPAPVVVSDVTALSPAPIGVSAPASQASNVILSKSVADASRVSSIDHTKKADSDAEKAVACSEETLSKVAEAKSQAEDAAGLATVAVSRCEDLWSQLAKQKDNGLTSEAEAKLASAAVAIAAAASVAKAAAAAAKIASNAALQAKLMADEAFLCSKTSGVLLSSGKPSSDVHDIDTATPKSNNVTNQSSSILVAAKEAAKRRVEAASAASRQAENLDGIVKAAELAAAAVSQAGKIVAMGEPLPLSELIEAGPEGYWKLPQSSAALAEKVRDGNMEQSGAVSLEKAADIPACDLEVSLVKGGSKNVGTDDVHLSEGLHDSLNVCSSLSDGIMGSQHTTGKDFRTGIAHKASETSRSGREASEPDALTTSTNAKNEGDESSTQAEDVFKEGSVVEIFKPGNGRKSAWYTANVLSLEDGRVHVSYNDLMSEEGPGHLQEWVSLEGEADKAPIIRAANPLSTLKYKTRKRRRAALGDYAWCVGDRVDVWIDDCWWEGLVTEKDEKDETTLKVNIPAQGETQLVRAWNLRASRVWIDGKWIEWSSSRGDNASEKSDTPKEKRQKLGSPLVATKAKDKESNNVDIAPGKPQQSKFLTLSTSDRTFDIGKTTNDVNKPATRRPLRTNQQKEGSRVIFGVPKPTGKKRKFMEVSKHFPANKSDKSSEVNDAVKFTKYLIPQGATSRAWKVPSSNDSKEKRPAESRPRVPSTRKTPRTLPQRGTSMSTLAQDADKPVNHGSDVENFVGHDNNMMEKSIDHGSIACEEGTEAPLSSLLQHSLSTTSKKTSLSHTKSDRLNRGKIVPSGGKLNKIEEDRAYSANTSKSNLDMSEPRRSNRRIQPTHRLLEGLQSSMVIPKMPSASHDKGRRNLARGK